MDTIDRINAVLKERGLTGADLSRKIGLSTAVYSQWNTRKTKPSNKNLVRVAEALEVPVSALTGERKEEPSVSSGELNAEDMEFWKKEIENASPETLKEIIIRATEKLAEQK